jgi:hypothetical protein
LSEEDINEIEDELPFDSGFRNDVIAGANQLKGPASIAPLKRGNIFDFVEPLKVNLVFIAYH